MDQFDRIIVDASTPIVAGEYAILTSLDGTYQIATYSPQSDWRFLNTRIPSGKVPAKMNYYEYEIYFTAEGAKQVKKILNESPLSKYTNFQIKTKKPRFNLISLTKTKH